MSRINDLDDVEREMNKLETRIKDNELKITEAFPEGDTIKHRIFHEKKMHDMRQYNDLREKVIERIVTGITWGILLGIGFLIHGYFKGF